MGATDPDFSFVGDFFLVSKNYVKSAIVGQSQRKFGFFF